MLNRNIGLLSLIIVLLVVSNCQKQTPVNLDSGQAQEIIPQIFHVKKIFTYFFWEKHITVHESLQESTIAVLSQEFSLLWTLITLRKSTKTSWEEGQLIAKLESAFTWHSNFAPKHYITDENQKIIGELQYNFFQSLFSWIGTSYEIFQYDREGNRKYAGTYFCEGIFSITCVLEDRSQEGFEEEWDMEGLQSSKPSSRNEENARELGTIEVKTSFLGESEAKFEIKSGIDRRVVAFLPIIKEIDRHYIQKFFSSFE